MIRVILPTNNKWLMTYFNTKDAYISHDNSKLNIKFLEKVIKKSIGNISKYKIDFEDRKDGQYFIIEDVNEIKWVLMSADYTINDGDGGSTNAYFVQAIPMAMRAMYEYETNKMKKLELYLNGASHNRVTTKTQEMYYRMAYTIGINILNKEELFKSETNIQDNIQKEIKSVEEWINIRSVSQERNNSNKSSYLIEDEKSYIFYGKTFGANGRESIFILYLLAKLAKNENKKIYLYEVNDNGSSAIESSMRDEDKRFKKMLEHMGIIYYIDSVDYVENDNQEKILNEKDKDARHQAEFMRNLIIKFNAERDENGRIITNRKGNPIIKEALKKCYLCDCNIQKTIIASHIQRVTDINKLNISFEEKRKKATDADNGFWLCANHDKMFEYGIIIFDEKTGLLKMNLDNLNQEQINYIENVTKNTKVSMVHFTKQLKEYLKIHNDRIKMENNNYIINYSIIEKKSNLLEIAEEKIEYTVKEV